MTKNLDVKIEQLPEGGIKGTITHGVDVTEVYADKPSTFCVRLTKRIKSILGEKPVEITD